MIPIYPNSKLPATKENFKKFAEQITSADNPLFNYLSIKAMEYFVKLVLNDKDFKTKVKENYLETSGGLLDKRELYNVTIQPVSAIVKNELKKEYIYSDQVDSMQTEIDTLETELKHKKEMLKAQKLIEINNKTASEILIKEVTESDSLKDFDLRITFK